MGSAWLALDRKKTSQRRSNQFGIQFLLFGILRFRLVVGIGYTLSTTRGTLDRCYAPGVQDVTIAFAARMIEKHKLSAE